MSKSQEPEPEAIFRSAEMTLVQLYIPTEIARETIYSLGSLGLVEFRDLNKKVNQFQRTFVDEIRKLDNVERQYRYFQSEMENKSIELQEVFLSDYKLQQKSILSTSSLDELSANAQILEDRITQLTEASESLLTRQMDLKQHQQVLIATDDYFNKSVAPDLIDMSETDQAEFLESGAVQSSNFITGVIPRSKVQLLQKILWRVLRGNLFLKTTEIEQKMFDVKSKTFVDKNSFVIFSHGEVILSRIRKICESLDADLYFVDPEASGRVTQKADINNKLTDVTTVLENTDRTLETELRALSADLDVWWKTVKLEKSVYSIMNLCYYDQGRKCLTAEGWIPTFDLKKVQNILIDISAKFSEPGSGSANESSFPMFMNIIETNRTPPTYHKVNKFTAAYQAMCDAYGVATYREVNAGLATIATFPFMFAIMFGDLGHGFLMFLAALTLVLNEKKIGTMKRDEIFDMAYTGRYIVLMMGAFSMYTGFLYNDVFSISMTWFKSGWAWPSSWKEGESIAGHQVGVYAFGLDPAWHGTENALLFSNSYKMKLSILMGFIHMSYSYVFSLVNALHFQSMVDIIGNFIPGLLFMQGIFGYLSICIIYKWCIDWIKIEKPAPSLLNMLINMFLAPGQIDEELYPYQSQVQVFLLLMALVCVPCLLLIKPLWFKHTHNK
ncbi:unnamed protein product [Ambrosiozyma monospora]|uniref:Unnamed protein product n=1 Tax=Ambrosiozyma monospora TaxID=43982 RepID=A0ACB5SUD8_AMBMO|nr:unnamed protein product [Ambrosiozyma monospora]